MTFVKKWECIIQCFEYAPFNLSEIIGATIADDEPDSLEDYHFLH